MLSSAFSGAADRFPFADNLVYLQAGQCTGSGPFEKLIADPARDFCAFVNQVASYRSKSSTLTVPLPRARASTDLDDESKLLDNTALVNDEATCFLRPLGTMGACRFWLRLGGFSRSAAQLVTCTLLCPIWFLGFTILLQRWSLVSDFDSSYRTWIGAVCCLDSLGIRARGDLLVLSVI